MTDAEPGNEPVVDKPKGPSAKLVAARERLGLTQKEVADKLYLTTTFIKYIDDGDFQKIPKPAFIRGYLRSYARVVELSGDDVVAMYEEELSAGEPAPEIRGVTEEQVGTASITGPVLQTGFIGLVGLVVVIAMVWWFVSDSDGSDDYPVVTQSSLPGPVISEDEGRDFDYVLEAEVDDVDQDTASQLQFTEDEATSVISSRDAPDDPVDEVSLLSTEDDGSLDETGEDEDSITIERFIDGERKFITVDAGGFDQIEFTFSDECWVEIDDSQYGLIYNDLNRENDVLTLYGTRPFEILLGKATGVEMIYNGRPFDLEPFVSQDNTAKLTISE